MILLGSRALSDSAWQSRNPKTLSKQAPKLIAIYYKLQMRTARETFRSRSKDATVGSKNGISTWELETVTGCMFGLMAESKNELESLREKDQAFGIYSLYFKSLPFGPFGSF